VTRLQLNSIHVRKTTKSSHAFGYKMTSSISIQSNIFTVSAIEDTPKNKSTKMPHSTTLVGSASRYIRGRNAVQTVYWIRPHNGSQQKFLKLSKVCNFGKGPSPPSSIKEMQNSQVKYYDWSCDWF